MHELPLSPSCGRLTSALRYYAIEDMLTTDPADKYGRTSLREHYERIAKEGQDYDPYTTLFGSQKGKEEFAAAAGKNTE